MTTKNGGKNSISNWAKAQAEIDETIDFVRKTTGKPMPIVVEPEQIEQFLRELEEAKEGRNGPIGLQPIDPEDLTKGFKVVFLKAESS